VKQGGSALASAQREPQNRRQAPGSCFGFGGFGGRTLGFPRAIGSREVFGEENFQFPAGSFPFRQQAADDGRPVGPEGFVDNALEGGARSHDRQIEQFRHVGISLPTADARTIGSDFGFHRSY